MSNVIDTAWCLLAGVSGTMIIAAADAVGIGHEAINSGLLIVLLLLAIILIDKVRSIPKDTANRAADTVDVRLADARQQLDQEKRAHVDSLERLRQAESELQTLRREVESIRRK